MGYLKNPFRQAIRFALILICLLNSVGGPASAERQPRSSRQPHSFPAIDRGRSDGLAAMSTVDRQIKARVRRARGRLPLTFDRLPLTFEANVRQADSQVKFYSRGSGYNLFLTPSEAILALRNEKPKGEANSPSVVRMKFAGAHSAPEVEGIEALPGKSHYFIGNDPGKWRRSVTNYAKVRYRGVYPGIDLVYYGAQQELEYDFIVAPGADPKAILLAFEGTRRIEVDAQGDLVLHTAVGQVRQRKPVTYQEVDGRRREIASRYRLKDGNRVGFEIGSYDRSRPLVINPALAYSTYLGGGGLDTAQGVAVDAEGNIYVAGTAGSLDFPADPLQPACNNCSETPVIYVAKLNREGSELVYSTYLGGSGDDFISDLAVDEEGNAYLTGNTVSDDFPTKDPLQPARAGDSDVFVTKLNAAGSALVYSTYLGGSHIDFFPQLAVDREGNAYVAGVTQSTDFPTRNPLQPALNGGTDAFVTKLNASGSALVYSTYLGGSDARVGMTFGDFTGGLAVDQAGNVYVAGRTTAPDFPTVNPLQPAIGGGQDAFVTKLNADGTAIVYSTYLGGAGPDFGNAVAVDALGAAYLTGRTSSTNFPTVSPLQPALSGPVDAFVSKINQDGSALVYSTYLGGTGPDLATDVAVDAKGQACVTGGTFSLDFPTADVAQPIPDWAPGGSVGDAFVVKLNPEGSDFIYSSYLGGGGADFGLGIAVDAWGDAYVVGRTDSDDLSVTPGAFQRRRRGESLPPPSPPPTEGFITKISNLTRGLDYDHGHNDDDKDHQ